MYQEEVDLVSNYTKNLLREVREDALLLNVGNLSIEQAGTELGQAQLKLELDFTLIFREAIWRDSPAK